jgi:hypothetical protein
VLRAGFWLDNTKTASAKGAIERFRFPFRALLELAEQVAFVDEWNREADPSLEPIEPPW